LALGGLAVVAAVAAGVRVRGDLNTLIHPAPALELSARPNPAESVMLMGMGNRKGDPFYLAGGTYRVLWSAWGPAAEFPPCTHSAELMAVNAANAGLASGHVADLAKFAHVPATGGSEEVYVADVKPGNYYVDVHSECGWQIALSPAG